MVRAEPIADTPLGVIDLLDGAFAALRQRPQQIVAIVAGLVVPLGLFEAWAVRSAVLDAGGVGGSAFPLLVGVNVFSSTYAVASLLSLLVTAVAGVAVSHVVGGWLTGRDHTALGALALTARRSPTILAAFVVIHALEAIGFVLLVVPGVIVVVASSLTSPVIAVEGLGPIAAIRRSWSLVRRRAGSVLGVILLLGLVQLGVAGAISNVPGLAQSFLSPNQVWALVAATNLLASLILVPVNAAAMCLTYLDIRFRTEGLDLQRRIDADLPATTGGP